MFFTLISVMPTSSFYLFILTDTLFSVAIKVEFFPFPFNLNKFKAFPTHLKSTVRTLYIPFPLFVCFIYSAFV